MNIDTIRRQIYDKTWAGQFWGHNGAIHLSRELYYQEHTPETLLGLASTRYAAGGNAAAKAQTAKNLFVKFFWWMRAVWNSMLALRASTKAERQIGLENMSADQLDVRASILERAGLHNSAVICIDIALKKKISLDTEVLLYAKKGTLMHKLGNESAADICFQNGHRLSRVVKPTTLVRYIRARALRNMEIGDRVNAYCYFLAAQGIARENNLTDQMEKIQPYLHELREVAPNIVRWDYVFPRE